MEKLPHESLREWAKRAEDGDVAYPSTAMSREMEGGMSIIKETEAFYKLADDIERVYIALPCDDKGEPWKIDDPVEYPMHLSERNEGFVYRYKKFKDEWQLIIRAKEGFYLMRLANQCKRPAPKVLDADGVEIKVGDTVWRVEDGLKMKVRAVGEEAMRKHGCSVATLLPDDHWDDYGVLHYTGKELTHREPDSLKKAVDDLGKLLNYPICDDIKLNKIEDIHCRIIALIERGA